MDAWKEVALVYASLELPRQGRQLELLMGCWNVEETFYSAETSAVQVCKKE